MRRYLERKEVEMVINSHVFKMKIGTVFRLIFAGYIYSTGIVYHGRLRHAAYLAALRVFDINCYIWCVHPKRANFE